MGILLYRPKAELCPVEGIFITGMGTDEHVNHDPQRLRVANEFLRQHPAYRFVEFHTHTIDTIARYGACHAINFSDPDLRAIRERIRDDPHYIGMLVTPETRLLAGNGEPQYAAIEERSLNSLYRKRNPAIAAELQTIASNLGYELRHLRVQ